MTVSTPVDDFDVAETITFGGGATGTVLAWLPGVQARLRFVVTSTTHPDLVESITGGTSGATGTVGAINASSDFATNVVVGDLFSVEDQGVPYTVASVTNSSTLDLSANYAEAADNYAQGYVSSSFTPVHGLAYTEVGDTDAVTMSKHMATQLDTKMADRSLTNVWAGGQHSTFLASTHSSGVLTLDLDTSNTFHVTMAGTVASIALTNKPAGGGVYNVVMEQDATGSRAVTSWAGFNFGAAGAPTIPTAAADQFILALVVLPSGDVLATFGDFS